MMDVIVPTWAEVNGWMFLLIVTLGFFVYAWVKGKQEEKRTVTWIRDWNEPNIKEEW